MKRKSILAGLLCLMLCLVFFAGCAKENVPSLADGDKIVYPGVQWFCTPEELLSALNLTENDVATSTTQTMYYITVRNLKLFGEEKGVDFEFKKCNDGVRRLYDIAVVYDASVDMAKIREKVEKSLGAAQEEPTGISNMWNEGTGTEPADVSGHIAYWDSKEILVNGTPLMRLCWTDDSRIWRLGTTDTDEEKLGILYFAATYVPEQ